MSALDAELKGAASLEGAEGGASASAASAAAAAGGSETAASASPAAAAADGCTLVAKWQGSTIELPVLPKSTTIGEVKVRDWDRRLGRENKEVHVSRCIVCGLLMTSVSCVFLPVRDKEVHQGGSGIPPHITLAKRVLSHSNFVLNFLPVYYCLCSPEVDSALCFKTRALMHRTSACLPHKRGFLFVFSVHGNGLL